MDRSVSLLVKFAALDRLTAPLRQIATAGRDAGRDISVTKREVLELQRATAKIGAFRDLQRQVTGSHESLDSARRRVRELRTEIQQTDGPTGGLTRQLEAAQRRVERLSTATGKQVERLDRLGAELRGAGVDVRNLTKEEDRLGNALGRANDRLEEQRAAQERADLRARRVEKMEQLGGRLQSGGVTAMGVGAAMTAPGVVTAKAAIDYESSFADVKKLVDGTPQQLAELNKGMLQLSKQVPISPDGIASIVALGARSGVAREELLAFAGDAARMGVAFDMTAEDAGTTMATWRTAFKLSQKEAVALGDRVNALTNAYGGNVAAVSEMVTRIGPLGDVAGVAAPSIASIAQLMNSVGVQSEIGATGIKNMMLALTKGESATKSQQKAWKALGLESTDVAARMQKDAEGTITDVLRRLAKIPEAARPAMLDNLFGSESIGAIAPLLTNLDALERNFALAGDQARYAGSMNAEFASRSATTANKLSQLSNRFQVAKIKLGNALLPAIVTGAEWLGRIAERFENFSDRHPRLASMLLMVTTVLGGLIFALGGLALGLGTIIGPLARGWALLSRFGGAVAPVSGLLGRFGAMLARIGANMRFWGIFRTLLGPIGTFGRAAIAAIGPIAAALGAITAPVWAIVAGIVAIGAVLAGVGVFIYNNWSGIVAFFQSAFASFSAATAPLRASLSALGAAFGALASAFFGWLGRVVGPFLAGLGRMGRAIIGFVSPAIEWFGKLVGPIAIELWRSWGSAVGGLIGGIVNKLKGFVDIVTGAVTALTNFFNSANKPVPTAPRAPASKPMKLAGARALGGPVRAGLRYLVGERGPEILEAPFNGNIIPNHELTRRRQARLSRPIIASVGAAALAASPLAAQPVPSPTRRPTSSETVERLIERTMLAPATPPVTRLAALAAPAPAPAAERLIALVSPLVASFRGAADDRERSAPALTIINHALAQAPRFVSERSPLTIAPSASPFGPTPSAAPAPARAAPTERSGLTINGPISIEITQAQGEDAGSLARRIQEELQRLGRADDARRGSSFEDLD